MSFLSRRFQKYRLGCASGSEGPASHYGEDKVGSQVTLSLVGAGENEIDPREEPHGFLFEDAGTQCVSQSQPLRLRALMKGLASVMRARGPRGNLLFKFC